MRFRISAEEIDSSLRCVFAVGIHHEDCAAADIFLNMREPNGNCPLVAKISAQTQDPYGAHRAVVAMKVVAVAPL